MRLYHFTARHHLVGASALGSRHAGPGILAVGIQPNPAGHPLIALPPLVWLTADGSFTQMWSTRPVPGLGCDRTEVRIEVAIPKAARDRLLAYERIRPYVRRDWLDDFENGFDLTPWFGFLDRIPVGWLRGVESRSMAASAVSA
jgi:hypothetical protein